MIYGPCDTRNPNAQCMENGKYIKRYPKDFVGMTTMDQHGYLTIVNAIKKILYGQVA